MSRFVFLGLAMFLVATNSFGHTLGTSFLFIKEVSQGLYELRWEPDSGLKISGYNTRIRFPEHCAHNTETLHCDGKALRGDLSFVDLPPHADVVVSVDWGAEIYTTQLISGFQVAELQPPTQAEMDGAWLSHFQAYFVLGIEHILLGVDHLLFVVGLVMLVNFSRKLLWTITAFTFSHSVTLGLSVLGYISVSQSLVEIIIALSILLLALEVVRGGDSLSKRVPWSVAFLFGLIHGFGFSGALRAIGLPEDALFSSLLAFNLGVEFGQLLVITLLFVLVQAARKLRFPAAYHSGTLILVSYFIGSAGAYWAISRSMDWLGVI